MERTRAETRDHDDAAAPPERTLTPEDASASTPVSNLAMARALAGGAAPVDAPGVTNGVANARLVRRIRDAVAKGGTKLPRRVIAGIGPVGSNAPQARIHTNGEAAGLARDLDAAAFTVGHNVFFGDGEYRPDSEQGRRLLRHELTHVAQQRLSTVIPQSRLRVTDPGDAVERDAVAGEQALGREPAVPSGTAVHRQMGGPSEPQLIVTPNEKLIEKARETKDPSDIAAIRDFSPLAENEKYEFIGILNGAGRGDALKRLWGSFGGGVVAAASGHFILWQASVEQAGKDLYDLGPIKNGPRKEFRQQVKAKANAYLAENLKLADAELEKLRGGPGETVEQSDKSREERAREITALVEQLKRAEHIENRLKMINVGRERGPHRLLPMLPLGEPFPVRFMPGAAPSLPLDASVPDPKRPHSEVQNQWDIVQVVRRGIEDSSPAVYAAVHHEGPMRMSQLEGAPATVATAAAEAVATLRKRIVHAQAQMQAGVSWNGLKPIHAQLRSAGRWSTGFFGAAAQKEIDDAEDAEFWQQLGLASLAAGAFVVSTLASGGLAAVALAVGVGAGVAQAAQSWEKYGELKGLSSATARSDLAVVAQGQADAALVAAVLDSVFAFVDGIQALGAAAKFLRSAELAAAAEKAAKGSVKEVVDANVKALAKGETIPADKAEQLIATVGVEGALGKGVPIEKLLESVAKDSPAAKLIQAHKDFAEEAAKKGISKAAAAKEVLAELRKAAPGPEADELAMQAISQQGVQATIQAVGGWKQLAGKINSGGAAASMMEGWRNGILADLARYMEEAAAGGPRLEGEKVLDATGTRGKVANDLDISIKGSHAEANRQLALTFLESRTGVASPEALSNLLNSSLFTDPKRMLLYEDIADTKLRESILKGAAEQETQLKFAKMLHDAAGNPVLQEELRATMRQATPPIREIPWRELGKGGRQRLASEVDDLHKQFDTLIAEGDQAAAGELARQIALKQALINVASGDAYSTGGAVFRWVTARQAAKLTVPAHKMSNLVEQLAALGSAKSALMRAKDYHSIEQALRSMGKYGDRVADAGKQIFGKGTARGKTLDALAGEFASIKNEIDAKVLYGLTREEMLEKLADLRARALAAADGIAADSGNLVAAARQGAANHPNLDMAKIQSGEMGHVALLGVKDSLLPAFATGRAAVRAMRTPKETEKAEPGPT